MNIYRVLSMRRALFQVLSCGVTALVLTTTQPGWYRYHPVIQPRQRGEAVARLGGRARALAVTHTASRSRKEHTKCGLRGGVSSRIVVRGLRKRPRRPHPSSGLRGGEMAHSIHLTRLSHSHGLWRGKSSLLVESVF